MLTVIGSPGPRRWNGLGCRDPGGTTGRGGCCRASGNGQLIRRSVLEASGGFNEDTVTDDGI